MQTGLGRHVVSKVGGRELSPARMWRSISFTCSEVRELGGLRIQWMIVTRKRSRELIHKRMMWWTRLSISASHRLGNLLKAQCFSRREHRRGQDTCRAGCCPDLEHITSTDCAFSIVYDSLPVFCLVLRHRISFQPFGFGLNLNSLAGGYDLYSKSVVIVAPES